MNLTEKLFTERFRPKNLDEIVLLDRIKVIVEKGLQQNILMCSKPGHGKTSLAYILCDTDKIPYLYINASRETSVDIVRDRIVSWCSEVSLLDGDYNRMKAVILDEVDGASDQFFKALRGTIEQFADEARFILTCNYLEKIPDAIISRFNVLELEPLNNTEEKELKIKYYKKVVDILNTLGVTSDKEGIMRIADVHFPDLRAVVTAIETLYISGKRSFVAADIKNYNTAFTELYNMMVDTPDTVKNYQFINENYSKRIDDVLISLGNDFISFIREKSPQHIQKIPDIIISVAEHQYKSKFTIDKFVNLLSCIYKIQMIINKK
jgi:DNA polymerase III delta prime subunit